MPNLTVSVTDAQAARISPALSNHYKGTGLEIAPLPTQAADFILSAIRMLVKQYEEAQAVTSAIALIQEL